MRGLPIEVVRVFGIRAGNTGRCCRDLEQTTRECLVCGRGCGPPHVYVGRGAAEQVSLGRDRRVRRARDRRSGDGDGETGRRGVVAGVHRRASDAGGSGSDLFGDAASGIVGGTGPGGITVNLGTSEASHHVVEVVRSDGSTGRRCGASDGLQFAKLRGACGDAAIRCAPRSGVAEVRAGRAIGVCRADRRGRG